MKLWVMVASILLMLNICVITTGYDVNDSSLIEEYKGSYVINNNTNITVDYEYECQKEYFNCSDGNCTNETLINTSICLGNYTEKENTTRIIEEYTVRQKDYPNQGLPPKPELWEEKEEEFINELYGNESEGEREMNNTIINAVTNSTAVKKVIEVSDPIIENIGWHIIIFILLFLVVIVVGIILWVRNKRKNKQREKTAEQVADELFKAGYPDDYVEKVYQKIKKDKG